MNTENTEVARRGTEKGGLGRENGGPLWEKGSGGEGEWSSSGFFDFAQNDGFVQHRPPPQTKIPFEVGNRDTRYSNFGSALAL
jgi:hypothetical protein